MERGAFMICGLIGPVLSCCAEADEADEAEASSGWAPMLCAAALGAAVLCASRIRGYVTRSVRVPY